jgi:hypothetical protein
MVEAALAVGEIVSSPSIKGAEDGPPGPNSQVLPMLGRSKACAIRRRAKPTAPPINFVELYQRPHVGTLRSDPARTSRCRQCVSLTLDRQPKAQSSSRGGGPS